MTRSTHIGLAAALSLGLSSAAAAQDAWDFSLTPYIWAPSVETSLNIGPNPPVDGSTSLLDVLDGAFLLEGEARRGRWSFPGEINYLNLGNSIDAGRLGTIGNWRLEGVMGTLGVAYAFVDRPDVRLEALAGLRSWSLKATTEVARFTVSQRSNWIDPLVGARIALPLGERWNLTASANVGGFGVGSDLQWEARANVTYAVSDTVELLAGYRHFHMDFKDSKQAIDMTLSGPLVAVRFRF